MRTFYGNRAGLEATIVRSMPLRFVPSAPLARRVSVRALLTLLRNLLGIAVALRAVSRDRPDVLIATGGYVCFPVVVAARLLRLLRLVPCRLALLETNVTPGLANRLVAPLVDEVWISYASSRATFGRTAIVTGTPVRASLREPREPAAARRALGLDPARPTIVVMGGSQGARSINDAIVACVTHADWPPAWQVLHVCGERDAARMREALRVVAPERVRLVPFLADPADAYAAADAMLARAGASTLAELARTATPAILVPYPHAAENHQAANAALFAQAGAAHVVADADLTPSRLLAELHAVLEPRANAALRDAAAGLMPGDAAAKIVERVTALAAARGGVADEPKSLGRD